MSAAVPASSTPVSMVGCPGCQSPFSKDVVPKVVNCGHTYCQPCAALFASTSDAVPCCICKEVIVVEDAGKLGTNVALLEFGEFEASKASPTAAAATCAVCEKDGFPEAATSKCENCGELACEDHARVHLKRNRDHKLSPVGVVTASACSVHDNAPIYHFCMTCKEAVCPLCLEAHPVTSTPPHEVAELATAAATFASRIAEDVALLNKHMHDVQEGMTVTGEGLVELKAQYEAVLREADEACASIVTAAEGMRSRVHASAKALYEQKRKMLETQADGLATTAWQWEVLTSLCGRAVESGDALLQARALSATSLVKPSLQAFEGLECGPELSVALEPRLSELLAELGSLGTVEGPLVSVDADQCTLIGDIPSQYSKTANTIALVLQCRDKVGKACKAKLSCISVSAAALDGVGAGAAGGAGGDAIVEECGITVSARSGGEAGLYDITVVPPCSWAKGALISVKVCDKAVERSPVTVTRLHGWQYVKHFETPSGSDCPDLDVTLDGSHAVIALYGTHAVYVYRLSDGSLVTTIGTPGSYGNGDHQFRNPYGVCVTKNNTILVADFSHNRVKQHSLQGQFMTKVACLRAFRVAALDDVFACCIDSTQVTVFSLSSFTQLRTFTQSLGMPYGLRFLSNGHLVISINSTRAGIISSADGSVVRDITTTLGRGYGAAVYGGEIFLTDTNKHSIMTFGESGGEAVLTWVKEGRGHGELNGPTAIAVIPEGELAGCAVVMDNNTARVQILRPL